ncbi:MAG: tRNA pseudouridine(55) synthase TruB [Actinomycetales bacterium]|nr:tRNA pseudouridine(55) synthase TruB [Actinomycetales bacterium]
MGRGSRRSKDDPSVAGVLCVDKPSGLTSHDVVDRVRRRLGVRRVGHAGTLDPMATGVLIIGVGPTTRLLGIITGHDKEYTATIRLGASTTTDDREGDVIAQATTGEIQRVTDASITEAVTLFTGALEQRPSAVSAVKVDGKRAHQRVRDGEEVELPARAVTVEEFMILEIRRGDAASSTAIDVDVRVRCSAGTYIRSLARDVGEELRVGGHLTALRRTRSGTIDVTECIDLDGADLEHLTAPGIFTRQHLPAVDLSDEHVARIRNGVRVGIEVPEASTVALIGPGEDLVAVVDGTASGGQYSITAVFPAIPPRVVAPTSGSGAADPE